MQKGIDEILETIPKLSGFFQKLKEAKEDGKVTRYEKFSLFIFAVQNTFSVDFKELGAEIKDLDRLELKKVLEAVKIEIRGFVGEDESQQEKFAWAMIHYLLSQYYVMNYDEGSGQNVGDTFTSMETFENSGSSEVFGMVGDTRTSEMTRNELDELDQTDFRKL